MMTQGASAEGKEALGWMEGLGADADWTTKAMIRIPLRAQATKQKPAYF